MIRLYSENDLPQLLIIENAAHLCPWSEDTFRRCLEIGYLGWVIEEDQKMKGFIVMTLYNGESHILNLCVHPDFQHQGLGRQLLLYALNEIKSRHAEIVYLEVRRGNTNAIALYEQLDFIQIGERKNYYPGQQGKKEDALVFVKDLRID